MNKYYTNIEIINDMFFGTVYNESNNSKVYQTKEYPTQSQAIKDANTFILTNNAPTTSPAPPAPQTTTNTIKTQISPIKTGRCCGR